MCFLICCCLGSNNGEDIEFGQVKTTRYRRESAYKKATCGNDNCCICLEDFQDDEEIQLARCNHGYHVECLTNWMTVKNTCPVCQAVLRRELPDENTPLLTSFRIDM